jgi:hypothetical protein
MLDEQGILNIFPLHVTESVRYQSERINLSVPVHEKIYFAQYESTHFLELKIVMNW